MDYQSEVDIAISENGDFVLCEEDNVVHSSCELQYVQKSYYMKQIISSRIKTMKPDWFYDHVGSNLEELLGKDNSKDTAIQGVDLITEALTFDGFVSPSDIYIKPSPISEFSLMYILAVRVEDTEPLVFKVNIALSSGINVEEA